MIFLTPYILRHIGIERYGIWAVVGVLTGYFGLLDFGMGTSFVKYISEYYAKKDFKSINQVITAGVIFYSVFGLFIVPFAFVFMDPLVSLFKIPLELRGETFFVFRLGIVLFAVSNVLNAFQSIQGGLQRMDVSNRISMGISVPMVIGTIYFLHNGYGLRGLMVNNAIIIAVTGVVNIIVGYRLLPELKIVPALCSKEMFRRLFGFGYKMQFAKIAEALVFQADRLLVAFFLNVGAVGFYQLGSSITQQMRSIPLLLVSAILPAASDMDAKGEAEKLKELYFKGTKYLILVGFPIVFFTIASAQLLIRIWVGPGYERAAWIIQVLAVGYLANLLSGVGTSVSAAIGKPEFQMGAAVISAFSNILLSLMLIVLIGFMGVAIATSVSLILGPVYFFIKLHDQMQISSKKILLEIVSIPFFAAALPTFLIWGMHSRFIHAAITSSRLLSLEVLALEGIAFLVIYLAIIFGTEYLDAYDKGLINKAIGHLKSFKLSPGVGGWGC